MLNISKTEILATAKQVFEDEISGLYQTVKNLDDNFIKTLELILNCKGKVILTGIGKSGHIAKKIAATFALHGDLGMIEEHDIVIAISYSGNAEELSAILHIIKRKNTKIIAITGNSTTSNLAKIANYRLTINIDKEACPFNLAPTTSTTATLVIGDALAICLMYLRGFKPQDFALSHPGGILGRKLLTYNSDIMYTSDKIPVVNINSDLKEVVLEISKKALGFAIVVNSTYNVIGVITDGDLRRRIVDDNVNLSSIKASDIMTHNPKVLLDEDLAVKSIELMENYKITGFIVVNKEAKLVGAFNLHDLIKAKLL